MNFFLDAPESERPSAPPPLVQAGAQQSLVPSLPPDLAAQVPVLSRVLQDLGGIHPARVELVAQHSDGGNEYLVYVHPALLPAAANAALREAIMALWERCDEEIEDDINQTGMSSLRTAGELLSRVEQLAADGKESAAIDLVYDVLDELLIARDMGQACWILRMASQSTELLPMSVLLSLLTVTLPWAASLPDRAEFFQAVAARARTERGAEEAARLLRGLDK
jgi:hypothetical protein